MNVIDIHRSPLRTVGLLVASFGFVAVSIWMLYAHPGSGRRAVVAGSLAEFVLYGSIAFFGLCAVLILPKLFQQGSVVSVGPRGIFDRRLSTDWIPWKAIRAITPVQIQRQSMLVLEVDPNADTALPWTNRARRMARVNRAFGPYGYWMGAADLRGGFPALAEAVTRGRTCAESPGASAPSLARRDP